MVLGGFAALAGCAGEGEQPPVTRRDSAGVEIVLNHVPAWSTEEGWRLDGPTLEIGSGDEADAGGLYRVGEARLLGDGGVLVENAGHHEIRLYDADGTLSWSFGGEGDGPGEFRSLDGARRIGSDSILVYDGRASRMTVTSLDGALIGTLQMEPTGHRVWELDHYRLGGRSQRGELLLIGSSFQIREMPTPMLHWDSMPNLRYGMNGARIGTIGLASGMLVYGDPTVGNAPEFFRSTHWGLSDDRFIIGDAYDYTFNEYRHDGTLERKVRRNHTPRPVETGDVERSVRMSVDRLPEGGLRTRILEQRLAMLHPDRMPAYSDLIAERDGHVWVRPYRTKWEGGDVDWDVFDPGGRWLGAVTVPERLRVTDIGAGRLLGVARDELGIESLRLYALVKP